MKYVPNFRINEQDDSLYLVLRVWHTPLADKDQHPRYFHSTKRIIYQFFEIPGANEPRVPVSYHDSLNASSDFSGKSTISSANDDNDESENVASTEANEANGEIQPGVESDNPEISIDELYVRLRDAHAQHDKFDHVDSVQHRSLLPQLTAYQCNAVQWMLHRETGVDRFPSEFVEIHSRWPPDNATRNTFYFHPRKMEISDKHAPFIDIPTGGILAEEMGLGKTIEMLSLVLLNRRPSIANYMDIESDGDSDDEPLIKIRKLSSTEFICVCNSSASKNKAKLIACTKCCRTQHRKCVLKHVIDLGGIENRYICPECWHHQPLIQSAATFIVSPASIKMQWHDEIERHIIMEGGFKMLIYDGINKNGWISPHDLAAYDVVITDYNVMSSEIHFANQNKTDRQMRNAALFMKMQSPLMLIDWWRVCLDEAQMVETANNQAARMVKLLPAQHRWAVTGTPLEKSIHDLYGLLFFMDLEPYDDHRVWTRIAEQFTDGKTPKNTN